MNLPTMPVRKAIGKNTTTSTSVIAIAALPISVRPVYAASSGASPWSRWRTIFSSTTIESSTRIPIVRPSPMSEITSSVNPKSFITMNVASNETGIEIMTTTALRHA